MESRFLMTGAVASVALHATLLLLLFAGPSRAVRRAVSDDGPEPAAPATNALAVAAAATDAGGDVPLREATPFDAPAAPAEPVPEAVSGAHRPPSGESTPAAAPEPPTEWVTYVVRRGDTLTGLARDTGCTLEQIARKNGKSVKALAQLKVGQRIKLPRRPH